MNVFSLLGKIVDDARHGFPHFECWCDDEREVVYDCCTDFLAEDVATVLYTEISNGYSIVFRTNDDCHFEICAVNYTDENGMEVNCNVRNLILKDVMSDNLLSEYHSLCDKAVELI